MYYASAAEKQNQSTERCQKAAETIAQGPGRNTLPICRQIFRTNCLAEQLRTKTQVRKGISWGRNA